MPASAAYVKRNLPKYEAPAGSSIKEFDSEFTVKNRKWPAALQKERLNCIQHCEESEVNC